MRYTMSFAADSLDELHENVARWLDASTDMIGAEMETCTPAAPVEAEPEAPAPAAETEKPKRTYTRRNKVDAPAPVPVNTTAPAPAASDDDDIFGTAAPAAPAATHDDLRTALQDLVTRKPGPAAKQILTDAGYQRIADVPEAKIGELILAARSA